MTQIHVWTFCFPTYRNVTKSTEWASIVTMVIKLCLDVADAASVVVCNSSPEGYIPVETDHGEDGNS